MLSDGTARNMRYRHEKQRTCSSLIPFTQLYAHCKLWFSFQAISGSSFEHCFVIVDL